MTSESLKIIILLCLLSMSRVHIILGRISHITDRIDTLIFDLAAVRQRTFFRLRIGTIAECPVTDHMYRRDMRWFSGLPPGCGPGIILM
jgi:hypothetical protein